MLLKESKCKRQLELELAVLKHERDKNLRKKHEYQYNRLDQVHYLTNTDKGLINPHVCPARALTHE